MLLPFISPQKYNDAIKKIFTRCGITRIVTVLNPTTGNEEKRPINEIASSHLARRTFIGNIYKGVKKTILSERYQDTTRAARLSLVIATLTRK